MSHFDINKIMSYKIPILNKETQQSACNYLKITEKLINDNNNKIELYNNLIKYTLDTIPITNYESLDMIINIYQITDHNPINLLIGIIKNGLSAGTVYLPTDHLPTNSHFLILKNENVFLRDYVYYYLKYIESQIIELSNLTAQSSLTKTQLFSLKIPKIDISQQKLIILECETFNNNIMKCIESNNDIKERDILGTIIKLNNL
jgi:restriction endonuclease S subunit